MADYMKDLQGDLIAVSDCGCWVERPLGTTRCYIVRCDLHAAAPERLEALRGMIAQAERHGVWPIGPDSKPIATADSPSESADTVATNAARDAVAKTTD